MQQTRKDVLNGWKEIAAYLGRDPRTVERWEKQRSLPVRRLPGSGRSTVYALVAELDAWLERSEEPGVEAQGEITSGPAAGMVGVAEGASSAEPGGTGPVEKPEVAPTSRKIWQRWVSAGVVLVVLSGMGFAGADWRRRHVAAAAEAAGAEPAVRSPARLLVPTSPVLGVEELYLRGCYQEEMRTPASLERARASFEEAIAKDGRYAPAYSGLATTYILLREYSILPDSEAYPKAKEAAEKALSLAPGSPTAHAALGFVKFFWDWDAAGSEAQFRQALEEDETLPLTHHWFGSVLAHEGRFREGLAELETAQRLDPSSAPILTMRAFALGLDGRRKEGMELLQEAITAEGSHHDSVTMHQVMGFLCLLQPRDLHGYLVETAESASMRRDEQTVASLRMAAGVLRARGEQAMWRSLLEDERTRHAGGGPTYAMARYEAQLGEKDEALDTLAELVRRHDPALIGISVDPLFARMRTDPRFARVRAAMGLPGFETG